MSATKSMLDTAIESMTGKSIEELRRLTLTEYRADVEKRLGRPLKFESRFPIIGRGNVMRNRTVSRDEIDRALDKVLS